MKFSAKKALLLGFVVVLLVAIPLTVYLVQQQVKTQTGAVPATNLSFSPQNASTTVGGDVTFDVNIDPGTNQVSFVKVLLSYDATKLATSGAGFVPNTTVFPSVLQGPTYGPDTISFTLSVGSSPQAVIQQAAKVGTVTFRALGATDTAPTKVVFGNQTQVLSIASQDQFNENVLSTTVPATINIQSSAEPTSTPTPAATNTPTPAATATLTPTPAATATNTPTPIPGVSATATLTPTPTTTQQIASSPPICTSLTIDRPATGDAPYNLNFTLVGMSNTTTISKVTFNFGDGTSQDVTQDGGIGSSSVNILQSHVYNTGGTFTATASLTDLNGAVSETGPCTQVLTINSTTQTAIATSPLPATGPSSIITFGMLGAIIAFIGVVLLLAL